MNEAVSTTQKTPLLRRIGRVLKGTATFEDRCISDHEDLPEILNILREMGCKVAFTSGVWDLFHIGHARYFQSGFDEAAKLFPDAEHVIMFAGVDSDKVTRERKKGSNRPIVPEAERMEILSYLRMVHFIVPQYEANTLYRLIRPDVRIISKSTKDLPDYEEMKKYCEHLVELDPRAEVSTTARVRKLTLDGAEELGAIVQKAVQNYLRGEGRP